jgi:2-dehydro-3-deoxygluconokinase
MTKVFCFGELLLRYSPKLNQQWIDESSMPVYIGGAELNTATALAKWGIDTGYATALPDNYLTKEIIAYINAKGIDSSGIRKIDGRIGNYILPQGEDMKAAGVIYDRAHSSFSNLRKGMIDWEKVLTGYTWFHFSAISPALNYEVAEVCKEGVAAASRLGLTVSIDLNYRAKLWQYGKLPVDIIPGLTKYCDLVMGNVWAAEKMLGIPVEKGIETSRDLCISQAKKTSEEIIKRFPQCSAVANTFRFDEGKGLRYYATLYTDGEIYVSGERATENVIDKVGSGDTFMAGLIYGNINHLQPQQTIDFATAAAFDKLFIKGDATQSTVEEINRIAHNHA